MCVLLFHFWPWHNQPATWLVALSCHDQSERSSASLNSGTEMNNSFYLIWKTTDNTHPHHMHTYGLKCMVLFSFLWFTQWVFSTKHAERFEKQNNYFNTGEKKYLEIKLLKACEEIKFFVVSAHSEYFWEVLITNFWAKVIRCAFVEETGLQYKQLFKKMHFEHIDLQLTHYGHTMKQSRDPLLFSKINLLIVGQNKSH